MREIIKVFNLSEKFDSILDIKLKDDLTLKEIIKDAVFLDFEHYIYKIPKCIGIFGAGVVSDDKFISTQYFLECKNDNKTITMEAIEYLKRKSLEGKKYIVTFAGENDFSVLNYMIKKFRLKYDPFKDYIHIDLQKVFTSKYNVGIGLKELENLLDISRANIVPSGAQIARTFATIFKDSDYINRMPRSKIENYITYNQMDILNLYKIMVAWDRIDSLIDEYKIEKEEKRAKKMILTQNT